MLIASVAAIATTPINIHHMPLEMYGAWLASGNILAWATMIDPGLSLVTQQQSAAAYGEGNMSLLGKIAAGGIMLNFVVAAVLSSIATGLVVFLPTLLGNPSGIAFPELQNACWVSCLGLFLNIAAYAVTSVCLGIQSSVAVGSVYLFAMLGGYAIQIALVIRGWGPMGIAIAAAFRGFAILSGDSVYLAWRFHNENVYIKWEKQIVRKMLNLVSFTFGSRLVGTLSSNIDSFFLVRLISPEAAVMMRSTRAPVDMCVGLVNRPAAGIAPVISHIAGAGELVAKRPQLLRLMSISLWIAFLAFTGLLFLNQSFVSLWVGKSLFAGHPTNAVLCLSLLALSASSLFSNLTNAIGDIKETSVITAVQAIVSLACMVAGGWLFGMPGVASGAGLGALYTATHCAVLLYRREILDKVALSQLGREVVACLFSSLLTALAASLFLPKATSWISLAVSGCGITIIFGILLLAFSRGARTEALALKSAVLGRLRRKMV
jgi:O-antigen/teichoic acid export membrane protein